MSEEKKVRKPRKPQAPRPLFVVVRAHDEAGNPIPKDRIEIVTATRDAAALVPLLESGEPVAIKRVMVGKGNAD